MHYIPFSVVKSIHEQTHSAMPNAPVVPHIPRGPRRRPLRALRRLMQRPTTVTKAAPVAEVAPVAESARVTEAVPALTLVSSTAEPNGSARELCEAEVRDRGTTTASAARAC
ncbi:hypothetical protein [Kribbella capetownensis]|uniref:hypothetical protein n=1 Tax=Kribbella capetownensis TaxID=1572659 RepID=UPI0013F49E65|nr:hypothetical protein [Kribbella capetownensis]